LQNGMTSTTSIIHSSGLGVNTVLSSFYMVENSLGAVNHHFIGVDNFGSHHLKIASYIFIWLQKIV